MPGLWAAATTRGRGPAGDGVEHEGPVYPDALRALQALAAGRADAVAYDAPILRYLAKEQFPGAVNVLPNTFVRQDYAIAVPQGSPLRETLNRVLEREIRSARWQERIYQYLGRNE